MTTGDSAIATDPIRAMTDPIRVIKQVFGPKQPAWFLATQLARDLTLMGAVPVSIERAGGWWLVSSAKDWLMESEGSVCWKFTHIVNFPEAGREAYHSEILLTAFADAVVTRGATGGITWIAGDPDRWALPARMRHRSRERTGRIVAFLSEDEQSPPVQLTAP
jgi:hypothetical protein